MKRVLRSTTWAPAHAVFFPLACLYAAAVVPLWTAQSLGWVPGGAPLIHAHEMVLGFAAAVIAGFLFSRLTWLRLAAMVAFWLAGRGTALAEWESPLSAIVGLAFPLGLAVLAGLPFLRAARSGHNLVFFPILSGLLVAEILYQSGRLGWLADGGARGIWLAFDLVMLLLLVMGGRILPAAMAGVMRAQGATLNDRNRPGLEWAAMAAMACAAIAHLALLPVLAPAAWAVAGLVSLVRWSNWRPLAAHAHHTLWPLHLGYAWLCVGLVLPALAATSGAWPASAALHAATTGGLGTITAVMMIRTHLLRNRLPPLRPTSLTIVAALLSAAACARMGTPMLPDLLMVVAAALWCLAFIIVGTEIALGERLRSRHPPAR